MDVSLHYLQRRPNKVREELCALAPEHAAYLPVQKLGIHSAWASRTIAASARVKAGQPDNHTLTFLTILTPALNKCTGRGLYIYMYTVCLYLSVYTGYLASPVTKLVIFSLSDTIPGFFASALHCKI